MTPEYIIKTLDMSPHPEGGWYVETWRGNQQPRAAGTAIYFLLEAHQSSHWHRVDAIEIWHWYAGGALQLHVSDGENTQVTLLGQDMVSGQFPQVIVPENAWQKAIPCDDWVLVGCTVSPGFEFEGFEMAPTNWSPGDR
ncbi:cupin domain-containing protein [bacterium]|nr:cupin domain-containing protein [bacterium]